MARVLINLDVPDLEAAELFYTRAFELRVGRRFDGVVELLGAEAPLYLLQRDAGSAWSSSIGGGRDYERHWTPVHLDFAVDDLDVALARAHAAGAKLEAPIAEQRWGRLALMSDPFGHGICLLQFRGAGYDELLSS